MSQPDRLAHFFLQKACGDAERTNGRGLRSIESGSPSDAVFVRCHSSAKRWAFIALVNSQRTSRSMQEATAGTFFPRHNPPVRQIRQGLTPGNRQTGTADRGSGVAISDRQVAVQRSRDRTLGAPAQKKTPDRRPVRGNCFDKGFSHLGWAQEEFCRSESLHRTPLRLTLSRLPLIPSDLQRPSEDLSWTFHWSPHPALS